MRSLQDQLRGIKEAIILSNGKKKYQAENEKNSSEKKQPMNRIYRVCPLCKCVIEGGLFRKHIKTKHRNYPGQGAATKGTVKHKATNCRVANSASSSSMARLNRLDKRKNRSHKKSHRKKIIAHNSINITGKKTSNIEPLNKAGLTREAAADYLRAMSGQNLIQDKEISEYIRRNPGIGKMGKFGVPQDRYRWGFYGSKSMAYDIWAKGDKGR